MAMAGLLTRGQPAAAEAITRAIVDDRPPSASLIAGPARVGKTTLALDLAAGLLCLAADPAARPCRACQACRKVEHGNHPDVHRVEPAGAGAQIRIDQARQLVSDLALLPLEGRYRVAILSQAQRLNPDAQHALLKLLEEPPAGAILVLCADDETLLLDTVRSRCARIRAAPVADSVTAELLVERGLADAPAAARLARLADGRPGVAISLAASPEVVLRWASLARSLLDLTQASRRERLALASQLLADAAVVGEALERRPDEIDSGIVGSPPEAQDPMAPSEPERTHAPTASGRSPGSATTVGEAAPVSTPEAARAAPAVRRNATLALIEIWRAVARDLLVAMTGGGRLVRDIALLEELERAGRGVSVDEVAAFLARLDGLAAAVEAYANPDLVVDVLLLAWPRARLAA